MMKKSRYTETQIVKLLKEVEAGRKVKEICHVNGISDAIYTTGLVTKNTGKRAELPSIYFPFFN